MDKRLKRIINIILNNKQSYQKAKIILAKNDLFIKNLINDPDVNVRVALTYDLQLIYRLIKDPSQEVKTSVIKNYYDELDRTLQFVCINSSSPVIRAACVERGGAYELSLLDNDNDPSVRAAVASKGFESHKFMYDKSPIVRAATVPYLYTKYPHIFVNDESSIVRAAFARYTNDEEYLHKLLECKDADVRLEIALRGLFIKYFVDDIDEQVRAAAAMNADKYRLNKFINDKSPIVRCAVARCLFGLDELINDEDPLVRAAVASTGYKLDVLINDEESLVRQAVAQQCYSIDKLLEDDDHMVIDQAINHSTIANIDKLYEIAFTANNCSIKEEAVARIIELSINDVEYIEKWVPITGILES